MRCLQPQNKKPPKAPDAAYLERAALYYLERFAASAAGLEAVLRRKIFRRCKARGESPEAYYANIAPLIERYIACGLLDDKRYTEAKIATLRRKGTSKRMIAAKLAQKGIDHKLIDKELVADDATELQAARELVRRKKLGKDSDRFKHDMAVLARAGFPYGLARRALEQDEMFTNFH
jgi:regulatory protein